jgi:hypothetical protein
MLVCPIQHPTKKRKVTGNVKNNTEQLVRCAFGELLHLFFLSAIRTTTLDLLPPLEFHGDLNLTENCERITKKHIISSCMKTT